MRQLKTVQEFQEEARNAIFTKRQAIAVTLRLLEMELKNPNNTPEDIRILNGALKQAEFGYLDMTKTETDNLLDSLDVARFTVADIVNAITHILFDVQ